MAKRRDSESSLPIIDWAHFTGLEAPAYTQVPDDLVDWVMAYLTGAELKVLLYIVRRTFGFKKAADAISIEQLCSGIVTHDGRRLDLGTALKRSTVLEALRSLRQKNLIEAYSQADALTGTRPTVYALKLRHRDNGSGFDDRPPGLPEHTPPYVLAYPPVRLGIPGGMVSHDGGVRQGIPGEYVQADPQETVNQQTVKQKTGNSNISKSPPVSSEVSTGSGTDAADSSAALHSELIAQVIGGYSILFHDRKHERSNCTRAMRLWHESALDEELFVALLHEARRITQQRGNIEREATDGSPEGTKNRMPYYFKVVEDLVAMAMADGAHTAA